MIADEVSIYNLALNAVGTRSNISATTEKDRGAEVCRLWYPVVRDQILSAAPWPSCRKTTRLALYRAQDDDKWQTGEPDPLYNYSYTVPDDMLYPRYLTNFARFELSTSTNDQQVIMTNDPAPMLVYTFRQPLVQRWEGPLGMAIVYGLAAHICMPLTGKPNRAAGLVQQANDLILTARLSAANEDNMAIETIPEWIRARGYANPHEDRYYYPYGTLLAGGITNVR